MTSSVPLNHGNILPTASRVHFQIRELASKRRDGVLRVEQTAVEATPSGGAAEEPLRNQACFNVSRIARATSLARGVGPTHDGHPSSHPQERMSSGDRGQNLVSNFVEWAAQTNAARKVVVDVDRRMECGILQTKLDGGAEVLRSHIRKTAESCASA